MQQTFPAEAIERVIIERVDGNLTVRGWERGDVSLSQNGRMDEPHAEGNVLMLGRSYGNLELVVPYAVAINARDVRGNATIERVRQVELPNVRGNLNLDKLAEDAIVGRVGGELTVKDAVGVSVQSHIGGKVTAADLETLEAGSIGGQADVRDIREVSFSTIGGHIDGADLHRLSVRVVGGHAELKDIKEVSLGHMGGYLHGADLEQVEAHTVGSSVELRDSARVKFGTVGNNLVARDVISLYSFNVGGDCRLEGGADSSIEVDNIGRNLTVAGAARVRVRRVGRNCELRDIKDEVSIHRVSGEVTVSGVVDVLRLGRVMGNLTVQDMQKGAEIDCVGGDLTLQAEFPPESKARIRVGRNARIVLPGDVNLTISARVGGSVRGRGVVSNARSRVILVYGEGAARLDLFVGGNLDLSSDQEPKSSTSAGYDWSEFAHETAAFGQEFGEQWREMGEQWREMGESIASSFADAASSFGYDIADNLANVAEEQKRRAEEMRQHVEGQARRARERAARVNIRFRNREWRMDTGHINRIVEEAQKAAADGIYGAMEAVEQALRNLHVDPGSPPQEPEQPQEPEAPHGPEVMEEERGSVEGVEPVAEDAEGTESAPAVSREQEREAILRMVAEGRITPEEGDMLLEGL